MNTLSQVTGEIRPKSPRKPRQPARANFYDLAAEKEAEAFIAEYMAKRKRHIRSRDDLSFTRRDEHGWLINWHVEKRPAYWQTGTAIGGLWFSEIAELAKANPDEAVCAIRFAIENMRELHEGHGHESGFLGALAEWAVKNSRPHGLQNPVCFI